MNDVAGNAAGLPVVVTRAYSASQLVAKLNKPVASIAT